MTEKLNEVNDRWQRNNREMKRLTAYGAALALVLWPVSYNASLYAAQTGQGIWFTAVSIASLLAALGATVGAAIGAGQVLTDQPPLPGSNY